MPTQCQNCGRSSDTLRRCAACSKVWYCGSSCQKTDWPIHLLDCEIGRSVTSADHLAAAIRQGIAPVDAQTRKDYGFVHTPRPDEIEKRMKVYSLLIDDLGIKPKVIHQWREVGVLSPMLQTIFDAKLSKSQRQGLEYEWFSQRRSTFGQLPPQDCATQMKLLDAHRSVRELIARTMTKSEFDKLRSINEFYDYFLFYALMLQGARPTACDGTGLWVTFGFCACSDRDEEEYLGNSYISLLRAITFREFIYACATSALLNLFSTHGQTIRSLYIGDVIRDLVSRKSVWDLKEFVCADDAARQNIEPPLPICVDYGFFNCIDIEEETCLRKVYKDIFDQPDSDPLTLHQACLQGSLFGHCSKLVNLSPPDKFRRLMMNVYPIQEPHEGSDSAIDKGAQLDESDPVSELLNSLSPGVNNVPQSEVRSALKRSWRARFCGASDPSS